MRKYLAGAIVGGIVALAGSAYALQVNGNLPNLIIAAGKILTFNNTLTFAGTDASTITLGAGGTVLYNGGALGTPLSGTATNLSGTAASLTAGNVTTNANLTGDVTSVGNAATIAANAVTNAKAAQMANSTIKCRTTAGTGNSEDCTAAQAAAIISSVGGALKSTIVSPTRDLTTATGTQAVTGLGFQPISCIGFGNVTGTLTQYTQLIGLSDSARATVGLFLGQSVIQSSGGNFMQFQDVTGANQQTATISSYDADGFTLSWTKTNSPTGTVQMRIMCSR